VSPEEAALVAVVHILERQAIPYMVTGSVASSFHGRPRSTHDADVVIDPTPDQLDRLVESLVAAGFYADLAHARDALRRRRQFNAIETHSASKIDFIIRKQRPFSGEELARRGTVELSPGVNVALATPEDTILAKLEWAKNAGGSERQLEDAAGIVAVNPGLDRAYLERWARELGVVALWHRIGGR